MTLKPRLSYHIDIIKEGRGYYLIRESEGKIPAIDNVKKSEYYKWYDLTDEQTHSDNVRTVEVLVRNLEIRCREKAGGWNIQRLHVRAQIKENKNERL